MALFNRFPKGLQQVFPSSGPDKHTVTELASSVSPIYAYPPRSSALELGRVAQLLSPIQVTPTFSVGWSDASFDAVLVDSTVLNPPILNPNLWAEILYGDMSHTGASAVPVQLFLRSPQGVNIFIARWNPLASVLAAGVASGFEPLFSHAMIATGAGQEIILPPWPLIIPPSFLLNGSAGTLVGAFNIELDIYYVKHPIAEEGFKS